MDTPPRPRLCHLRKSPDFAGYGFNLRAEKGKAGQYIGKVDEGSPAESAGLHEGDRIVEVNGINVGSENHSQVVQRVKAVPDEVKFLVVDEETDDYYRDRKIVITADMADIDKPIVAVAAVVNNDDDDVDHDVAKTAAENNAAVAAVAAAVAGSSDAGSSAPGTPRELTEKDSNESVKDDEIPAPALFAADSSNIEAPDGHRPRQCTLMIWPDFDGYGFNLHANRGESAQFIGKVDADSPADLGGLKEGDRIIEVNGVNVENESHPEVVRLIKSKDDTVTMLVVDTTADAFFKERGVTVSGHMTCVERITCPDNKPLSSVAERRISDKIDDVDSSVPPPVAVATAAAAVASKDAGQHPHRARLCVVCSWADGRGYGFSMQAQKGADKKPGQYIGKVEDGTPAELAGLRQGDRIVEVNGSNVESSTHKEVVDKIKAVADKVELLVVDVEADKYFSEKSIKVASTTDNCVEKIICPSTKPATLVTEKTVTVTATKEDKTVNITATKTTTEAPAESGSTSPPVVINGIEFAGSVQEARRRMSKKKSVTEDRRTMKDKYELFRKL